MSDGRRVIIGNCHHCVMEGLAAERSLTANQFVEHHAKAEQIAPSVELMTADLLGRHITGGAEQYPGPRLEARRDPRIARTIFLEFLFSQLGQAKVEHLRIAVRSQHDVLGLDVAMNDSGSVRGAERAGDLNRRLDNLIER